MILKIIDNREIQVTIEHDDETYALYKVYTVKIRNAIFRTKGKRWDGSVEYFKNGKMLLGFWLHASQQAFTNYNFKISVEGLDTIIDSTVTEENISKFCMELMSGYKHSLRPYQIKAVYLAVKYNYCIFDLATSAGKTLIIYMYITYLRYVKKLERVLIICPDPDLVVQFYNDFMEYSMNKFQVNHCQISGNSEASGMTAYEYMNHIIKHKIVIGNFQSLGHKDPESFKAFSHVICDEAHRGEAETIKNIMRYCTNAKARIGLTGSLIVDKSAEYFNLVGNFGPTVLKVTKKELMDNNWATQIKIKIIRLNWASEEVRRNLCSLMDAKASAENDMDGADVFALEQNIIRSSKARLLWICRFTASLKGNTIVFFLDKKQGYGRAIVDMLKTVSEGKEIYYIDGDVPNDLRNAYKQRMEEGDNKILVASYPTYSTGKSINRLVNIVNAESVKSETAIDQATGRGMRLSDDKPVFNWYDIADDLSIDTKHYHNTNYMLKHLKERCKWYVSEGFEYTITDVDLRNMSQYKFMD